jgi:hypothetical protein
MNFLRDWIFAIPDHLRGKSQATKKPGYSLALGDTQMSDQIVTQSFAKSKNIPIQANLVACAKSSGTRNPAFDIPLRKTRGTEEIKVTPEIAQHWLTFNAANRDLVQRKVAQYRSDMECGNWNDDGAPIRFAYGKLLDGQHRLHAIVEAGVRLPAVVVYGLDGESQVTMDTGRCRSPRDILSIEGLTVWDAQTLGSAIHAIIANSHGLPSSSHDRYTNREVRDFFLENRGALESSLRTIRDLPHQRTIISLSRALSMHYLFSRIDSDQADQFFQRLCIGDGVAKSSPIFHLRQRLTNDLLSKTKRSTFVECAYLINTWNAYRRGSSWKAATGMNPKNGEALPEAI